MMATKRKTHSLALSAATYAELSNQLAAAGVYDSAAAGGLQAWSDRPALKIGDLVFFLKTATDK